MRTYNHNTWYINKKHSSISVKILKVLDIFISYISHVPPNTLAEAMPVYFVITFKHYVHA